MAILIIEHHDLDSSQRLGDVLRDHGQHLDIVRVHRGESLPPDLDNIDGLISMGGPQDVDQIDEHDWMAREVELIQQAHESGTPVLGVCLGAQLLAHALGGEVSKMEAPELGIGKVTQSFFGQNDPLLAGIPWNTWQMHAHGCEVTKTPTNGTPAPLVSSPTCKAQAFRVGMITYGIQYHFEWTQQRCHDVIDFASHWQENLGKSADQLKAEVDEHYDLYRHLGDRQCKNICDLLFPVDKRLPPTFEDPANFRRIGPKTVRY